MCMLVTAYLRYFGSVSFEVSAVDSVGAYIRQPYSFTVVSSMEELLLINKKVRKLTYLSCFILTTRFSLKRLANVLELLLLNLNYFIADY